MLHQNFQSQINTSYLYMLKMHNVVNVLHSTTAPTSIVATCRHSSAISPLYLLCTAPLQHFNHETLFSFSLRSQGQHCSLKCLMGCKKQMWGIGSNCRIFACTSISESIVDLLRFVNKY